MKTKLLCFFLNLICSSFIKVSIKYEKLFFFRNWSLCIVTPVSDGHEWWESNWASCGLFSPAVLATVRRAYLRGGNTMKWSTSWRQGLPTHPIRHKLALINLPSPWPPFFVKLIWPKLDSKRAQPVLEREKSRCFFLIYRSRSRKQEGVWLSLYLHNERYRVIKSNCDK